MIYKENKTVTRTYVTVDNEELVKAFSPEPDLSLWEIESSQGRVSMVFGKVIELTVEK